MTAARAAAAALLMLTSVVPQAIAKEATLRLAGLVLTYDDQVFAARAVPGQPGDLIWSGVAGRAFFLVCIAPDCTGRPFVWASTAPTGSSDAPRCPPAIDPADGWSETDLLGPFRAKPDGLPLVRWVRHSRCRAYTPSAHRACLEHQSTTYSFGTGGNFGCSGIEGVSPEAFHALLDGLRPVSEEDGARSDP